MECSTMSRERLYIFDTTLRGLFDRSRAAGEGGQGMKIGVARWSARP
jgi:hypothetical protein